MTVRWTQSDYDHYKAKHSKAIATPLPLSKIAQANIAGFAERLEPKPGKRVRQSNKPLMNKLETEFYTYLTKTYNPLFVHCQAIRFRLGNGIWFKPDVVIFANPLTCYEVKGPHAFRGGFENLKVAAGIYESISWHLVWKESGQWKQQTILP